MKKIFLILFLLFPFSVRGSGLFGSYLPISGGTLIGPLTFPSITVGDSLFKIKSINGGASNDTFQLGYNLSNNLYVPNDLTEPQLWLGFETNYLNVNQSSHATSEMYLRVEGIGNSTSAGYVNTFYTAFDRITGRTFDTQVLGDDIELKNSDGTTILSDIQAGHFQILGPLVFTAGGVLAGTSSGPVMYSQNSALSARFYNGNIYFNGPINFKNLAENATHMIINDSGVLNMGSSPITNLTDPTNAQDAATKNYVDNIFKGAVTFVNALTTPVTQVIAGCSSTSSFAFGEKGAALASSFGWTSPQATTIVFNGTFAGAATISYIGMK